jgi:hypothetical protein
MLERPVLHEGFELAKLSKYLDAWRELPGLPSELYPPAIELTRDMFTLRRGTGPER